MKSDAMATRSMSPHSPSLSVLITPSYRTLFVIPRATASVVACFTLFTKLHFGHMVCSGAQAAVGSPGRKLQATFHCTSVVHTKERRAYWDSWGGVAWIPDCHPVPFSFQHWKHASFVSLPWQLNDINLCDCEIQIKVIHIYIFPLRFQVLGVTQNSFLMPSFLNFLFRGYILDDVG